MRMVRRKRETVQENKDVFHATGLAWSLLFGPSAQFAARAFRVIRDSEPKKARIHVQPCPSGPRIGRSSQAYSELIHRGPRTPQSLNALRPCGSRGVPSMRCLNRGVYLYFRNRRLVLSTDKAGPCQVDARADRYLPVRAALLDGAGSRQVPPRIPDAPRESSGLSTRHGPGCNASSAMIA